MKIRDGRYIDVLSILAIFTVSLSIIIFCLIDLLKTIDIGLETSRSRVKMLVGTVLFLIRGTGHYLQLTRVER